METLMDAFQCTKRVRKQKQVHDPSHAIRSVKRSKCARNEWRVPVRKNKSSGPPGLLYMAFDSLKNATAYRSNQAINEINDVLVDLDDDDELNQLFSTAIGTEEVDLNCYEVMDVDLHCYEKLHPCSPKTVIPPTKKIIFSTTIEFPSRFNFKMPSA